jgi:transposase
MEEFLSPEDRRQLIQSHKHLRDGRVRDRIKAVLLYNDGYTYSEIARILLLDDETIRRHIQDYQEEKKLNPDNGGSQSFLSLEETAALIYHLENHTYFHVKEICAYVQTTFKKTYSESGMTKWLHRNCFCYKKPHGVPAKADRQKQEAFIAMYTELKASCGTDEPIYFADSVHPQHQTQAAFGWIKKGVRKEILKTSCQKRVNLIGAINLATHQVEHKEVDWVNFDSLKAFVVQLCAANPFAKKIHLILDNAGYHKSKEFTDFIQTTHIQLHYLPPYSPNLNPIERLWKIMREQVTYNQYYCKFSEFRSGILEFFENISYYQSIIQSRINDNFQRLALTP